MSDCAADCVTFAGDRLRIRFDRSGRNVCGFELKESYHQAALQNIAKAKRPARQTGLFSQEVAAC